MSYWHTASFDAVCHNLRTLCKTGGKRARGGYATLPARRHSLAHSAVRRKRYHTRGDTRTAEGPRMVYSVRTVVTTRRDQADPVANVRYIPSNICGILLCRAKNVAFSGKTKTTKRSRRGLEDRACTRVITIERVYNIIRRALCPSRLNAIIDYRPSLTTMARRRAKTDGNSRARYVSTTI